MKHIAYVGLGSNLSEPVAQLQRAFADLAQLPGTELLAQSSLYRSAPVGFLEQPDFVNAVAKIATELSARQLLLALLEIELQHGRERTFRNAPRTLDMDVLLYDNDVINEHGLHVPHPQMHLRAFVLMPLLEISPDCAIPGQGCAADWLARCADQELSRMEQ